MEESTHGVGEQGINKTNQTYRGIAANKPKLARPPVNGGAPPPTQQQRYNPDLPKAFFHDQDCLGPGHIDAIWIVSKGEASKEEGEMACSRPAMEMDLSAQAWLLIREARDENSQEMEEVMEQISRVEPPPKVYFSGTGRCAARLWRREIAGRLDGTRSPA